MYCPNCGAGNEGGVRFCANCGTSLAVESAPGAPTVPPPLQPEVVPSYAPPTVPQTRDSFLKFLGMGCLILLAIFVFGGLSCAKACLFGRRRVRFGRGY
jgi:hypothetical protein